MVKNLPANARDVKDEDSIRGSGRSLEKEMLQYPCLENSIDGGAWQATIHGVAKSWA